MSSRNRALINVALAYCDTMLQGFLTQALDGADGIRFHGHLAGSALLEGLQAEGIDVVIVQVQDNGKPLSEAICLCHSLLEASPGVSFIALQKHGAIASVFELRPALCRIGATSTDDISALVRNWKSIGERRVLDIH